MGDDSLAGTLPERKSFLIALASALMIIGIYDGFYDRDRNFPAAGAYRSGALYDERGGGYDKGDQSFV